MSIHFIQEMHMRTLAKTAILSGLLLAVPAMAFAGQGSSQAKPPATAKSAAPKAATPATHATTGVIKSIDATSLVISKGKNQDTTFSLSSATERKGNLATGASVQVRYHTEGKQNVATAVSVQEKKK